MEPKVFSWSNVNNLLDGKKKVSFIDLLKFVPIKLNGQLSLEDIMSEWIVAIQGDEYVLKLLSLESLKVYNWKQVLDCQS